LLERITPLVLTYNEAPNIGRTIAKLSWARRIVVIDSGSTDDTLGILRDCAQAVVIQRRFDDFASQCNFGLTKVDTDWVLSLDADYELSDALVSEIAALPGAAEYAGYRACFIYRIHGRPLRRTLYPPRTVLYRRDLAQYHNEGHGHCVAVRGEIGTLSGVVYHDDRKPLSRWIESQQRYAAAEARYLAETPLKKLKRSDRLRRMGWPAPIAILFYTLIVKGCILDGWPGWSYALQRLAAETMVALAIVERRLRLSVQRRQENDGSGRRATVKPMRITIVMGPFYPIPPLLGGATEKVHLLLAGAYRRAGHEVTIVSRRYRDLPHDETIDGVRYLRIASYDRSPRLTVNLFLDLLYAVRVARALPAADVTVTNAVFLPLILPHRRAGKIYVQVGRYPKWQIGLYVRADRIQAVSNAVGRAIARQAPWLKHKTAVIGCALPESYFAATAEHRREIVLYVGRVAREKGIETLIAAFALIAGLNNANATRWRLRVVGPDAVGHGGDGPQYLAELKRLAARSGVPCDFAGPVFDQSALIGEYRKSAVFVYPSIAETGEALGLAPLEAMAAGCATIVSDLACFDDYLEDGVTGLRFDHRGADPAASLASKLERLMRDDDFRRCVGAGGRRAAGNFRVAPIAARMLDDFRMLTESDRRQ
jgi:glycosyltransferase involved in cell wall biosynthesis